VRNFLFVQPYRKRCSWSASPRATAAAGVPLSVIFTRHPSRPAFVRRPLASAAVGTAAREHFDRIFMTNRPSAAALVNTRLPRPWRCPDAHWRTVDMVAFPRIAGESDPEARTHALSSLRPRRHRSRAVTAVGLVTRSRRVDPFLFGSAYSPAQRIFPFLCLAYALRPPRWSWARASWQPTTRSSSRRRSGDAGDDRADNAADDPGIRADRRRRRGLRGPRSSLVFLAYLAMRAYGARIGTS